MFEGILNSLLKLESVLVVTHARPDGDAVGSQLALGRFLDRCGLRVVMASSNYTPNNLAWLDPAGRIEFYDGSPLQLVRLSEVDGVVIVDANAPSRLGSLEDVVSNHRGKLFVIDHHPDPVDIFDVAAVDTSAASTGEMIFDLIALHDIDLIDEEIAVSLYAAIMTDTGSFRYGNVTPALLRTVATLLERGSFTTEEIYNRVYKTRTEAGQLLLGAALESLKVVHSGVLGYMTITRRMFERTGATSEDVEAFTDHILSIEGVSTAILFMEVGRGVKMSFRSQGEIPVNELAAKFGGGGHKNASGAFTQGSIESVVQSVVSEAARYLPLTTLD